MSLKKLSLILISLSLSLNVFSQEKKNQINFSIGPSFGVGDFGDNHNSNKDAGFAGAGANLYLYYSHQFIKKVGLGIKWFGNSNKYDTDPAIKELNSSTGTLWTTSDSYWSTGGFLIGITFQILASERIIVDFRVLGGYVYSTSPECKFSVQNQPNIWVKMVSASTGVDGYDIGAGFTYLFHPRWGLNINLDYMLAVFRYDKVFVTSYDGTTHHVNNVKQPFEILNLTIGISFYF